MFMKHESFNVGPSIFAPEKQDVKMRPYFVPERTILEESSSYLFQQQSSELSDSKVSSIPETESITSIEDLEDKKFPEEDSLPEREAVECMKEVIEGPSGNPELNFQQEIETEEYVHQEPEVISKMESVSEHIGYGSQSSEEENSLELSQAGKRDVHVGESQMEDVRDYYEQGSTAHYVEVQGYRHGSDFEDVEPRYTRISSSSSLSEESERVFFDPEGEGFPMLEDRRDHGAEEQTISTQTSLGSTDLNITSTLVNNISRRALNYDSSSVGLSKNVSSSSISSDLLPQFDLGSAPVMDKLTMSSIGSESKETSREIEMAIPHNIEMLHDSSTYHPVAAEDRAVDFVDIREHDNVHSNISGFDQISKSEGSSATASSVPHMFISLGSSGETLMEEHLMEKHILDEVSVSVSDKNIHTMVGSSEDHDLEQAEEKHLLLSEKHCLIEASETQFDGLPRAEHLNAVDESAQSPNSDAEIQQETSEKKLTYMLLAEGNTSLFHDNSVQEPDFNYLNEVHASSTPVESLLDGQIVWDLNMPAVQEHDHFIYSPLSPKFVPAPPSAFEMNVSSTVDEQTVVEEADEIKEIDDGLLSELDSVGDFSVGQLGSGTGAYEKRVECAEEESWSSTHDAETSTTRVPEVHLVETNKMEHLLRSEKSREDINAYEQDLEQISELLTYQTSISENIDVPRKEFDENEYNSPCREIFGEEMLSKENEVLPAHLLVSDNHVDSISGMAEIEVRSLEIVGSVAKKAELASVGTEVMAEVAEVSCQVDKDATSGMPELQASSIDLALQQISSKESKKHFILDPPPPEFQNHEYTVSTVSESEVLSADDNDAVLKNPESAYVETEIVVGVADVYCRGQVDTYTASGMTELEASTVEDIDLAFKHISAEVIEKPLVLEPVDIDAASQMPELEDIKTEDIDLVSKQIISKDIEKHVVLGPPRAKLLNYEDTDSGLPEQEVQLDEDVHAVSEHTKLTPVENEIIMEDAVVSSQGQVIADNTSEITEIEHNLSEAIENPVDLEPLDADTTSGMAEIEAINLAFKHISSEEVKYGDDDLEPVHTDITSAMPEIEATSVGAINLAFEHISSEEIKNDDNLEPVDTDTSSGTPEIKTGSIEAINLAWEPISSEETKNCDVLEPLRPELVVGENITENSEDAAPHTDTIVPVSTNETSDLEVGRSKVGILDDKEMDDRITGIDGLHDSVDLTEKPEDAEPHMDRSAMVSTNVTPITEVGPNKDAILDGEQLTDNITGTNRLYDRTLHAVEFGETPGATSEMRAVEAIPAVDTTVPPKQVLDAETTGQLELESDDESMKVKADNKRSPSEEESSIQESSAFEAEKPKHEG